jgi:hypothetical protein
LHALLTRVDEALLIASIAISGSRTPLDPWRWLPSARECEIITVPDRADPVIQRGG